MYVCNIKSWFSHICILVFDYILQRLAFCYTSLSQAYTKAGEVIISGRRLLGKYFRVGFYGVRIFIINETGGSFYLLVNKNFNWKIPRKPGISKCQLRWDILYEKQKKLVWLGIYWTRLNVSKVLSSPSGMFTQYYLLII